MPYDPPNQAAWMNGSTQGYAAYKVANHVTSHQAYGLGSYCYFLTYFIVNAMAFWLDVVWTLLVMTGFVLTFVSGTLLPVSIMPAALREAFAWTFPYWALSAPIEIYLGRLGTEAFVRGLGVLVGSVLVLELARRLVWERGRRRYAGGGM